MPAGAFLECLPLCPRALVISINISFCELRCRHMIGASSRLAERDHFIPRNIDWPRTQQLAQLSLLRLVVSRFPLISPCLHRAHAAFSPIRKIAPSVQSIMGKFEQRRACVSQLGLLSSAQWPLCANSRRWGGIAPAVNYRWHYPDR